MVSEDVKPTIGSSQGTSNGQSSQHPPRDAKLSETDHAPDADTAGQAEASISTQVAGGPPNPSLNPNAELLRGLTIELAENQFPKWAKEALSKIANVSNVFLCSVSCVLFLADTYSLQSRGAIVVAQENPLRPDVLLVNPCSIEEKRQKTTSAGRSLHVLPYHWLLACHARSTVLPLNVAALVVKIPTLVNPNQSTSHAPLAVWVSVNIHRQDDEPTAWIAQENVRREVMERGGIIMEKRGSAEILVVDRGSKFFKETIMREWSKNRKGWRMVERDWVDSCVRSGKITWPPREMDDDEDEPDSLAEEAKPEPGRGPGRPTGKYV